MIKRIIRTNLRRPAYSLAVLLFTLVLTVVLCYLHMSGQQELESYEKTYASVPVTFRVTDLDGSKPDEIVGWVVELFTGQGMKPDLSPFVEKLYSRLSRSGFYTVFEEVDGKFVEVPAYIEVSGIDSFYVAEELTEDWGGQVFWQDGYDEPVLSTEEAVCLVPESMKDMTQIELTFSYSYTVGEVSYTNTTVKQFQVVGYFVDPGNTRLYCPYPVMQQIYAQLGAAKDLEEVCAVLNENNTLPELRQVAAEWFAEPNPSGEKTPWGKYSYEYYLYALDINDYMLKNLESGMKSSMRLNTLASLVIFILSAGAGFLTGFLVIRARKREIALMRSMGASHPAIFAELALEQMLCVAAGIVLGGLWCLWQPIDRLALFGMIYFVGLSVALLVFLRKNLLTGIKEE